MYEYTDPNTFNRNLGCSGWGTNNGGSQAQGAALFSSQVGYFYKTLAYAYFYDANCGSYRVDATLSPAVYRSF